MNSPPLEAICVIPQKGIRKVIFLIVRSRNITLWILVTKYMLDLCSEKRYGSSRWKFPKVVATILLSYLCCIETKFTISHIQQN